MYINSYLESNVIDLSQYCTEKKYIEVCAAQINIGNHIILLCIYRIMLRLDPSSCREGLKIGYTYSSLFIYLCLDAICI